jgi:hypothetical protein
MDDVSSMSLVPERIDGAGRSEEAKIKESTSGFPIASVDPPRYERVEPKRCADPGPTSSVWVRAMAQACFYLHL